MWKILDAVIDTKFPFILAHASPFAVVPETIRQRVKVFGFGILTTWAPQQMILGHKVTGWFLTHGGQNSITEALAEGIPMYVFPAIATSLSLVLNVSYQLVETRTGAGLKPLKRGPLKRGVKPEGTLEAIEKEARWILADARGPNGKIKRQNAEAIKVKMGKAWKEGGEAITQLRELLSREL
ncbi:glycosyltransferase family 1 protein [Sphaerobolus stellatus SS14]|uniref:Glycosyltransferase family 1 protein n=1 Tax=Sphaerobolus stellatus (strain SS14) TaxID=990650 RepID=A0A0C9W3E1_SPHS4|nr:glycosyltransferase family 1 protein [Sphaerobolus stellatus SS14]